MSAVGAFVSLIKAWRQGPHKEEGEIYSQVARQEFLTQQKVRFSLCFAANTSATCRGCYREHEGTTPDIALRFRVESWFHVARRRVAVGRRWRASSMAGVTPAEVKPELARVRAGTQASGGA